MLKHALHHIQFTSEMDFPNPVHVVCQYKMGSDKSFLSENCDGRYQMLSMISLFTGTGRAHAIINLQGNVKRRKWKCCKMLWRAAHEITQFKSNSHYVFAHSFYKSPSPNYHSISRNPFFSSFFAMYPWIQGYVSKYGWWQTFTGDTTTTHDNYELLWILQKQAVKNLHLCYHQTHKKGFFRYILGHRTTYWYHIYGGNI